MIQPGRCCGFAVGAAAAGFALVVAAARFAAGGAFGAAIGAGAAGGWASAAGKAACDAASEAVRTPGLAVSVLTSRGRIGSVEPAAAFVCVSRAAAAGSDRNAAGSADGAAELKRTGKLVALATANRGSALASAFGASFGSTLAAATFGSALVTTIG